MEFPAADAEANFIEFDIALEPNRHLAPGSTSRPANSLLADRRGSSPVRNVTEDEQHAPRELVTEKDALWQKFYFHVRCHPPRFGRYDGAPACLVTLDYAFLTSLTKSRFKNARVEVSFEDGPGAVAVAARNADTEGKTKPPPDDAQHVPPEIVAWEPQLWQGLRERGEGSTTATANVTAGPAGGPATSTLGITRQTPFVRDGSALIHGVVEGNTSSRVVWTVDENEMSSSGFVEDFSTPIIVKYTAGRRFAARVKVTARIDWSPMPLVAGEKDDPLLFDPVRLNAAALSEDLKVLSLKDQCRLGGYGGTFVVE